MDEKLLLLYWQIPAGCFSYRSLFILLFHCKDAGVLTET